MKSKVLNWYNELVGKTIKAIEIDDGYNDISYIITEDSEIFAFKYDSFDACIYKKDEKDIINAALKSASLRDLLFDSNIITQEQYNKMKEEEDKRKQESQKRQEEYEYQQYLKLKEKFKNK